MYEDFFGFRERPFDLSPSPRFVVLTEAHREALRNLEYAISSRKGVTLLVGEAGAGKTTMIRTAISKQPGRVQCVHVQNPTLTRQEFCAMLASQFALSTEASESKAAFLRELEALLRRRREEGDTSVLILDEAQSLPLELLEEVRLLANIETDDDKLLSVIIAGQPELAARLNEHSLRQLKQRVALRCELRGLRLEETAAYIASRIRAVGGVAVRVFTRDAVTLLHEASRGLPRTINVIADNALLGAFAADRQMVTSDIVREVCRDFDIAMGPERAASTPAAPPPAATSAPKAPARRAADAPVNGDVSAAARRVETPTTPGLFSGRRKRFSLFGE